MSNMLPLVAQGATLRRRGRVLVGPVDLTLGGSGVTIVIGPNGAGKTSLLRMLHGIERLSAGSVDWACDAVEARARQSFVFQAPILMRRNVRDNIAYPLLLDHVAKSEARAQAETWARAVGLGDALNRPAPRAVWRRTPKARHRPCPDPQPRCAVSGRTLRLA